MSLHNAFIIVHLIGLIIGLGSASVADVLSFQAFRSGRLSLERTTTLKTVGNLVWLGLSLLLVSGFALLAEDLIEEPDKPLPAKPLVKLGITIVIAINGLMIHRKVIPLLKAAAGQPIAQTALPQATTLLGITAAISVVSWWSAFLLGAWRRIPLDATAMVAGYLGLIVIGILISLVMMPRLMKQSAPKTI